MYPSTMDLDDANDGDLFACGELLDLEALVQKMSKKEIDVASYRWLPSTFTQTPITV